jgi:hypothetical protein
MSLYLLNQKSKQGSNYIFIFLKLHVKCRTTFREAVNKKKSLKDKEVIQKTV